MSYRIHVIADNSSQWTKPSPGRLRPGSSGNFVATNGFGFEDWNFNLSLAHEGRLLAHSTAIIAKKDQGDTLNIIWAVLLDRTLYAIGCYTNVKYTSDEKLSAHNIDLITKDIFNFAQDYPDHISEHYKFSTFDQIRRSIGSSNENFKLLVDIKDIRLFASYIRIPSKIIDHQIYRARNSFKITEDHFFEIVGQSPNVDLPQDDDDYAVDEGTPQIRVHTRRERDRDLVNRFKNSLTDLSCSVCNFNFEKAYGELGRNFIECHHTKPISQMKPGDRTSLNDLVAVCSNCHRMLHRTSTPMLTPAELEAKLLKA